jgi:hypothetical protein
VSTAVRRLRAAAGLAAAVVPCAIVVHLVSEAAAIGADGLSGAFVARHAYFAVLLIASAAWFAATVGLGRPAAERRRRCALIRAELNSGHRPYGALLLASANIGFFALTQAVEGIPIASGALALGLCTAVAGSLLSALLVFVFGGSLVIAGLESVISTAPLRSSLIDFSRYLRI